MIRRRLSEMMRGWFVGDFAPTTYRTGAVEVAVKSYRTGDAEAWHYHRIATEITVVVSGEVEMNGARYRAGDIVVVEPGEGTDFVAITDCTNVVVKVPGATNDKYLDRPSRPPVREASAPPLASPEAGLKGTSLA